MLVKRLHIDAQLPTRALSSAGYDLYPVSYLSILPGKTMEVPLGIAIAFPDNLVGLLFDRSGLGRAGIIRRAGVIDSNYRGEWVTILYNSGDNTIRLSPQKACIQVVFVEKVAFDSVEWAEELPDSVRGNRGFGSTDI